MSEGPSWSDIADWYDGLLVAGSGPHETALETLRGLVPDTSGRRVLDVACGQGIAARLLASLGAEVIAVDLSEAMIERARRHGTPAGLPITYLVGDAQTLAAFDDDAFEGATCQLGLMDIPDLDATLAAVARVVEPGGWFAFVIGHPCFLVPGAGRTETDDGTAAAVISGYFREHFWRSTNPEGVRRAGNYHRRLSTYLSALSQAGFDLELAVEPEANAVLADQQPLYSQVPIFFAARVRLRRAS